jgi:hypothetical protein
MLFDALLDAGKVALRDDEPRLQRLRTLLEALLSPSSTPDV